MANAPTINVPTVSPSAQPLPTQQLNAPAAAFSGNVEAQALTDLGQVAQQHGQDLAQYALQMQALDNKQAADDSSTKFVQAADSLQLQYHEKFPGMAAADPDNLTNFQRDLENLRTTFGGGMPKPAQVEYETATRRYQASILASTSTFAAAQRRTAITQTDASTVDIWAAKMAANPDDPGIQSQGVGAIIGTSLSQRLLNGWNDTQTEAYVQKTLGAVYAGQVGVALNTGDIPKAQALFSQHKDDMDQQQIDAVQRSLKTGEQLYQYRTFAADIVASAQGSQRVPQATSGGYVADVGEREGTGQNPRSSAFGTGQFINKTWLEVMKTDPQFSKDIAGKSDKEILALRSNPEIGQRAIVSYGNENSAKLQRDGFAPTAANVGLAHGFGPDGAEAILSANAKNPATPAQGVLTAAALEANPQLAHRTVGQLVSEFQRRFSNNEPDLAVPPTTGTLGPPPPIDPRQDLPQQEAAYMQYAETSAQERFSGNPVAIPQAVSAAKSQLSTLFDIAKAQQAALGDRLISALADQSVTSRDKLALAYPGATTDLANAPPNIAIRVNALLKTNSNVLTPEKEDSINQLLGMEKLHPQDFAKEDLSKYDLRQADYLAFRKTQLGFQAKQTAQLQSDHALNAALSSPTAKTAIQTLGIAPFSSQPTADNTEYNRFAGALSAELDAATARTGKPPTDKERDAIINSLTVKAGAKKGWGWFNWGSSPGTPAYQIPDDRRAQIVSYLAGKGIANPTEEQIQLIHRGSQ